MSNANERADTLARGKEARAFVTGEEDGQPRSRLEPGKNGEERQASADALHPHVSKPQEVTPPTHGTAPQTKPLTRRHVSEEEPDPPTTPSQRTVEEQDTSRRRGLSSSPSKRPPLRDPVKPSLLKTRAPAVQQDRSEIPLDEPIGTETSAPDFEQTERQPPDPELVKRKQEKNRLLQELQELQDDVSRCTEEITKIQRQPATHVLQPAEREDLVAFINKIGRPDAEADEQTPAVSSLLCSFLPFSTRPIPLPVSKPQQKPVASHRPLELDDPLPYLEMFTDFKISTQPDLPRGRVFPDSNRVHQKHVIDIVSTLR